MLQRLSHRASRSRPARGHRRGRSGRAAAASVLGAALLLAACAQDAWKPNPQLSEFENQVMRTCGTTRLGEVTISQLMNPGSALYSAYFVDMTSRYDSNRITTEEYVSGLSATFNTVRDSAGIRCIVAQKPTPSSSAPPTLK